MPALIPNLTLPKEKALILTVIQESDKTIEFLLRNFCSLQEQRLADLRVGGYPGLQGQFQDS